MSFEKQKCQHLNLAWLHSDSIENCAFSMQWFTFDSPKCCCCVLVNRFVSYSEIFLTVCPLIVLFRLLIKSTAFCKHHFAKTVRYTLIPSVLAISFHLRFCFVLLSSTQGRTVVLFVDTVIQSDSWTGGITTQERSVRARYTHARTHTPRHSPTHTHHDTHTNQTEKQQQKTKN